MITQTTSLKTETGFNRSAIEALSKSKNEPAWMLDKRLEAWHLYGDTPFPATTDELWRRTPINTLDLDGAIPFVLAQPEARAMQALPEKFQKTAADENASGVLVQYNSSNIQARLDPQLKKRGVIFCDLDTATREHPELVKEYLMTKAVTYSENRYKSDKPRVGATGKHEGGGYGETVGDLKFAALHGAFLSGGTFLYVPRGVAIELPLQTLTYFDAPNAAIFSHSLVILEDAADVKLIENYASQAAEPQRFSAGAVELIVKPGASLQYFHLQDYAHNVWHFSSQTALLEKDTSLTWLVGTLGSQVTKAFLDSKMLGEGANAKLLGFFFGDRKQHFDQHTFQNHIVGHTASDLLYKGALKDEAHSVFRGLIRVNPNAQRSDAYQANRNILLSPHSHADSIPELEIEANDVRCTHGATVGPIDEDQVFYALSRGIDRVAAQRLIVEGFFEPLMEKIPLDSIRTQLTNVVHRKIAGEGW